MKKDVRASSRIALGGMPTRNYIRDAKAWPLVKASVLNLSAQQVAETFDIHADYELRNELIAHLRNLCSLDQQAIASVREIVESNSDRVDELRAHRRKAGDRAIAKFVALLPTREREAHSLRWVLHKRSSRRLCGVSLLAQNASPETLDALRESYALYRDDETLLALLAAGDTSFLRHADLKAAIGALRARYLQARALEHLLDIDRPTAVSLSEAFPVAFVWGAGRRRDADVKAEVVGLARVFVSQLESATAITPELLGGIRDLGLFIWSLTRMGGDPYLSEIAARYDVKVLEPS